jgi:hypothetical protein
MKFGNTLFSSEKRGDDTNQNSIKALRILDSKKKEWRCQGRKVDSETATESIPAVAYQGSVDTDRYYYFIYMKDITGPDTGSEY